MPPHCHSEMERLVKEEGIEYNVTIHDLEQLIREERKYRYYIHSFHWHSQEWSPEIYHNLEEIEDRLESLLSQHSSLLSRQHLGVTAQGRNIDAIIVKKDNRRTKPVIWLDCGIHAREWVSPPACLHAIHTLVQDSNSVQPQGDLLDAFDFYILPVANPDGYVYSWTHNRMWRKNRAGGKSFADDCTGVDPNRNFDADFASAPRHQCKESYRGTHAFSEAESRAIKRGVELIKSRYGQDRLAAFVSIHAYSQFWMSPMGYTWDRPKDYNDHMRVMKTATDALTSVYGTRFKYGPISEVIYIAAGSSVDWAYENAGIKYSFGLELRDSGRMGFMLPQVTHEREEDKHSEPFISSRRSSQL